MTVEKSFCVTVEGSSNLISVMLVPDTSIQVTKESISPSNYPGNPDN